LEKTWVARLPHAYTGAGSRSKATKVNKRKEDITLADLLTDDGFLAWQLKNDETEAQEWQNWMDRNPENAELVNQAIQLLSVLASMKEKKISDYQVNASFDRLMKKITRRENRFYSIL